MSHVLHHRARYQLHLSAVKTARRGARDLAQDWGLDNPYDLLLTVSELVGNAVQHAGTPDRGQVTVAYTLSARRLRVEVRDPSDEAPVQHEDPADPEREHGRGLAIVDALTRRWGVEPQVIGKIVWVEFCITDLRTSPPPPRAGHLSGPPDRRG
ncbi:ATP-binding protein [Kitasatospora sp. NPDC058048]|uniref:ATP-binding protein n=1 Tax=Kitasatospora sp. NPDC058048 TaxID=3346313 RepID=UPI0036D7E5BE